MRFRGLWRIVAELHFQCSYTTMTKIDMFEAPSKDFRNAFNVHDAGFRLSLDRWDLVQAFPSGEKNASDWTDDWPESKHVKWGTTS
jgi:hypothetical protein